MAPLATPVGSVAPLWVYKHLCGNLSCHCHDDSSVVQSVVVLLPVKMSDYEANIRSAVATAISVVAEELIDEANEILLRSRPRKPRSCWTRKWISRRTNLGASKLLEELAREDGDSFRNHLRMSNLKFEELLNHVAPRIQKSNTRMRMALPAKIKLQITLRYLATGDSFSSLQYLYRVPKCTISKFVPEVCEAIFEVLMEYLKVSNF